MKPYSSWRIGFFLITGAVLLGAALAWTLKGVGFQPRESTWLHFSNSVYGLQVGAPVVLRGVPMGQVKEITLAPPGPQGFRVPVRIELDASRVRQLVGGEGGDGNSTGIAALVQQGLVARLSTQSLLTGQLYVDLDFDPTRTVRTADTPNQSTPPRTAEIPTVASPLQDLQAQLQGIDLPGLARDLSTTAQAARRWLDAPGWARTLEQAQTATASLTRLATAWERQAAPLGASALTTLQDSRQTLAQLRESAQALNQTAEALGKTAHTWEALASEDSAVRQQAQQALQDVSRTARAVRELSEMLERHPDALLRGRSKASE
ncbi:MAG: MlaD family protein [Burkholderiaceae bacterium]|nr:MlaD family protein [Burkholderiaceae bacterium]